jgi:sterol desaturase/sphingolipid hydroxylase (fatty acid hydroxylase superfamily)
MLERVGLAVLAFVLLGLVYTTLERAFPARQSERFPGPAVRTDACFFFGQYLIFSSAALVVLAFVHQNIDAHAPVALRSWFVALPLVLRVTIAVLLGDVLVYWFHRACHRFEALWRFHAVHHSVERLDWLAAHREHPVDGVLTQLFQNLPAMVLGLPFEALGVLIAFRGAWAIFIHSNVRLPLGPLRILFGAPELHHFHHRKARETAHNFANLAPYLDLVFGTYHRPHGPETYPVGLPEPRPRGYLALLVEPFRRRALPVSPRVAPALFDSKGSTDASSSRLPGFPAADLAGVRQGPGLR